MKSIKAFFNRIKPENITSIITGVVIAALLVLSTVFYGLESSGRFASDITSSKVYTLSQESVDMVAKLKEEVSIYTLYSPGNENQHVSYLLKRYAAKSGKIKVANVDPSGSRQELSFVEDASSLAVGAVVVVNEDKSRYTVLSSGTLYITDSATSETYFRGESKITSAISYVITGDAVNIKLLYGHQETADEDIIEIRKYLDSLNYNVSRYDYLRSSIPLDAATDILVAVSPKTDLTQEEYKGISAFLKEGGTFIVLMDSCQYKEDAGVIEKVERTQERFTQLLCDYGLMLNDNIIISEDLASSGFRSTTLITIPDTASMRKLINTGGSAVLSECASIEFIEGCDAKITPLLTTSEKCYNNSLNTGVRLEKGENSQEGAFTVAAKSQKDNGKLILFSSSSFIKSSEISISANSDAFLDAIAFADARIGKTEADPKLINKGFVIKSGFVRFLWVMLLGVILPSSILALGIYRAIKRKRITLRRVK